MRLAFVSYICNKICRNSTSLNIPGQVYVKVPAKEYLKVPGQVYVKVLGQVYI